MPETHLTTEEQIRLVNGASFFGTAEIPEKEIQRLQLLDGGTAPIFHGSRFTVDGDPHKLRIYRTGHDRHDIGTGALCGG